MCYRMEVRFCSHLVPKGVPAKGGVSSLVSSQNASIELTSVLHISLGRVQHILSKLHLFQCPLSERLLHPRDFYYWILKCINVRLSTDILWQGKSGELLPVALQVQDEVAKLVAAQQ